MVETPFSRIFRILADGAFELRSPLITISGYARMLQVGRAGPLSDKQEQVVNGLVEAARAATLLVEKIERVSFMAEGHWDRWRSFDDKEAVKLTAILREIAEELNSRRPEGGSVTIQADAPHDDVLGNQAALKLALTGLIRRVFNARETLETHRDVVVAVSDGPDAVGTPRRILIAPIGHLQSLAETAVGQLSPLDESGGLLSLDLQFALRVIEAHGGTVLAVTDGFDGTVVLLPPRVTSAPKEPGEATP